MTKLPNSKSLVTKISFCFLQYSAINLSEEPTNLEFLQCLTSRPNLVKTSTLTLTSVTTPVKVGVKPKINILGKTEVCGETKTEI